jgi:hypothetical protein
MDAVEREQYSDLLPADRSQFRILGGGGGGQDTFFKIWNVQNDSGANLAPAQSGTGDLSRELKFSGLGFLYHKYPLTPSWPWQK